ncbi:HinT-interacting membrane complex protein P80 [Metamycoplasma auris]|uniref:Membrane protein P80 n=1 Tax=Metamycoplasma auris TaxID=51363 RepID=A0A2W7FZZ7_9BACT|nr:hypothetical protein [Metamycoplasma auris]PZV99969.1 hypothetical protein BCF89_10448 [Metamycoplasma auris]
MSEKMKKNKTTEQKTKRKRILWGAFWATAISAAIAAGIGIPLAQASKALPKPSPVRKDTSGLFTIDNNGKITQINYGDIDKNPVTQNKNKHTFEAIKSNISKFLYEKEYEASLKYQAIYNANKAKSDEKTFALDSWDQIKKKIQDEINDIKKQYQKQHGLEKKWEEKFLEELGTDKWGKSKNEKQALEYRINQEIEKVAYLGYKTEVNNDWTYEELKNGIIANKDVSYTINGKEIEIAKKGQKISLADHFGFKENVHYVLPKEDSIEHSHDKKSEIKVPIFTTKSFVKEFKDPLRFIKPWLAEKQAILSEFMLSAKQDETGAEKPWKVNKDEIIKLLNFSAYETTTSTSSADKKQEIKLGIDRIKDFAGFSTLIKDQDNTSTITDQDEIKAKNDKLLIERVSSDTSNANKFGSKGFINLDQTISSSDPSTYLNLLSIVLGEPSVNGNKGIYKHTDKSNLFEDLKKNLVKALTESSEFKKFEKIDYTFSKELKEALNGNGATSSASSPSRVTRSLRIREGRGDSTSSSTTTGTNTQTEIHKYAKYNAKIKEIIEKLDDKKINDIFGVAFRDTFAMNGSNGGTGTKDYRISSIYKVGSNFVSVTEKGILVQNIHQFKSEEQIKNLIIKDLGIKSKANYKSTFTSELFDLSSIFSQITSSAEFQFSDLLSKENSDFTKYIKDKKFTPLDANKERSFNDQDLKDAKKYISTFEQTTKTSIVNTKFDQIKKFIKKQVEQNLYTDYKYDASKNMVTIECNSNQNGKDATTYLFETVVNYVFDLDKKKEAGR